MTDSIQGSRQSNSNDGDDPPRSQRLTEVSFVRMAAVLLRYRWTILLLVLAGGLVVLTVTVLAPPYYTSRATFVPQSEGTSLERLSGIATQLGVQMPTSVGQPGQSPAFYANLLRSRELRRATVTTRYGFRGSDGDTLRGDLVELFSAEGDDRPQKVANAIKQLAERTEVTTATETAVVEIAVETRWPELSQRVAQRMMELVNRFNTETRRSQAEAEREFLAERVEEARQELLGAEDSLETFLTRNRQYQNSPQLQFEKQRLQRRVDLRQQVYSTLATSYEQAKVEEVRDTPVITIVDPPEIPATPDPSRLFLKLFLGLMVGATFGIGWALVSEMLRTSRETDPDTYVDLMDSWEETKGDMREVMRKMRRTWFSRRSS